MYGHASKPRQHAGTIIQHAACSGDDLYRVLCRGLLGPICRTGPGASVGRDRVSSVVDIEDDISKTDNT